MNIKPIKILAALVFVIVSFFIAYMLDTALQEIGCSLSNPKIAIVGIPLAIYFSKKLLNWLDSIIHEGAMSEVEKNVVDHFDYKDWKPASLKDNYDRDAIFAAHLEIELNIEENQFSIEKLTNRVNTPTINSVVQGTVVELVARPLSRREVISTVSKILTKEDGYRDSEMKIMRSVLTVQSYLYGYEIPAHIAVYDDLTLMAVTNHALNTRRVTKVEYQEMMGRSALALEEFYKKINEEKYQISRLMLDLPIIHERCLFYVMGGYHGSKTVFNNNSVEVVTIKQVSTNGRPIGIQSFMKEMQNPDLNIFNGFVPVESMPKISEESYRMAMTLSFMKMFGWVPYDFVSYNQVIAAQVCNMK